MKFYPSEWLSDQRVMLMSPAQKGIYIDLLCHAWTEGSIPSDPREIARLLHVHPRTLGPLLDGVLGQFCPASDPSRLTHKRLEKERKGARQRAEQSRNAANTRHHKDAGAVRDDPKAHMPLEIRDQKLEVREDPTDSGLQPLQGSLELKTQTQKPKLPDPKRQQAIEVLQHYKAEWIRAMKPPDGKPPEVSEADWGQLSRLVRQHGKDACIAFVDRYLVDDHPAARSNGYALRNLPVRVNAYRVGEQPPPREVRPLTTAPSRSQPPPLAEVESRRREVARRDAERHRAELERAGYRWDESGRMFDPEGNELDARGRRVG